MQVGHTALLLRTKHTGLIGGLLTVELLEQSLRICRLDGKGPLCLPLAKIIDDCAVVGDDRQGDAAACCKVIHLYRFRPEATVNPTPSCISRTNSSLPDSDKPSLFPRYSVPSTSETYSFFITHPLPFLRPSSFHLFIIRMRQGKINRRFSSYDCLSFCLTLAEFAAAML